MDRRIALIPYLALAALVLVGTLWHLGDLARPARQSKRLQPAKQVEIGGPFSLTDQNGVARTDKDYRGKYLLVFFGYTYCPDVCPTTLAVMTAALDMMGSRADRVVPLVHHRRSETRYAAKS